MTLAVGSPRPVRDPSPLGVIGAVVRNALLWTLLLQVALPVAAEERGSLTGTWKWGNPRSGGGILLVIEDTDSVTFQLELWRGAPSYNMGSLDGTVALKNGKGTFRSREDGDVCEIAFEFRENKAILRQTAGTDADCGFGFDVHADGTFRRISRKKPALVKASE